MEGTATNEQAVCPGCQDKPPMDDGVLCADCAAEERAGSEDTRTQSTARQENHREQSQRQQQLPAQDKKRASAPANGTDQKRPPAQAQRPAGEMPATPPAGATTGQRPAAAPSGKRMSLGNVVSKPAEVPHKVGLYGPEGTGKTTFGMESPDPIFLAPEFSSILEKSTIPRFPQPQSWDDMMDAVDELITGQHNRKTLVIDTFDRAEELAQAKAVELYNRSNPKRRASNIEEVGGGFMKGYVATIDVVRGFIVKLERLIEKRRMNVIILAHGAVRKVKDPSVTDDYEQWDLALYNGNNASLSDLVRNWLDTLLFVNFETRIKFDFRGKAQRRAESPGDGNRVLYTQRTAGWRAKNRDGLPLTMPFSWERYEWAMRKAQDPDYLVELIKEKATEMGDEAILKWVTDELGKKPPVQRLIQINLKLAARLEKMVEEAEAAKNEATGGAA